MIDLTHKKLKQVCRKNQYCLALTFMGGDADEFKTGKTYSENFSDELSALILLYIWQLKEVMNGCSARDAKRLKLYAIEAVLVDPALHKAAVNNEEYAERCASNYLRDLGHGCWGGHDIPRVIWDIELTHFDDKGDEYKVMMLDRNTFRSTK